MQNSDENKSGKTLIVGNLKKAVIGADSENDSRFIHCEDMLEAISLASRDNYKNIYVVMSDFGTHLDGGLETLRQASAQSRITLLAEVYEEPVAMSISRNPRNPKAAADDYMICPVDKSALLNGQVSQSTQEIVDKSSEKLTARMRQLEQLATHDDLTNLKNRRYVREFLRQILDRAKKQHLSVTLLIFDIDDFKKYNDSFGHHVGDNVLKQAALMMRRSCREHDVVARIGGDEFAVVFWDKPKGKISPDNLQEERRQQSGTEHPGEVYFITERFRNEISSSNLSSLGAEGKGELTISGGLASFPRDGRTVEELFEQADKAMLEAKKSGKNRINLVGRD